MLKEEKLTGEIIGAAIEVHRILGPGLLESVYEECLAYELKLRGLSCERQVPLPVRYKEVFLDCGYRMDLVVEGRVVVEIKAVQNVIGIHEAQLLTHLQVSGKEVGLLINFNTVVLKDGITRRVI